MCVFWNEVGRTDRDSVCVQCAETVKGLRYVAEKFPIRKFDNVQQELIFKWNGEPEAIWRGEIDGKMTEERVPRWQNYYAIVRYGSTDGILVAQDRGLKLMWINKKKFISMEPNIFTAWFRIKKELMDPPVFDDGLKKTAKNTPKKGAKYPEEIWTDI